MKQEILEIQKKESSFEVKESQIASLRHKNITKKGVRVFQEGKISSASHVGPVEDSLLITHALENKEAAVDYDYDLPSCSPAHTSCLSFPGKEEDLHEELEKSLDFLSQHHPQLIFSGRSSLITFHKKMLCHDGTQHHFKYDMCQWNFFYKHKASASIIDGYFKGGALDHFGILSECKRYSPFLSAFENKIPLKEGKKPIVFINERTVPLWKALKSTHIDLYKQDIELFKNQLGKKSLHEKLSINDISYHPEKLALNPFDGEGIVRPNPVYPLFEKGVFTHLICDLKNAQKYKSKTTGNAQRGFDSGVNLSFNSVCVEPGTRTVTEILKDLPECLIIETAAGGNFMDTGEFSTPVENAFLARNGDIVGKIPPITLTSTTQKMLNEDFIEVSKDFSFGLNPNSALFMKMNVLTN